MSFIHSGLSQGEGDVTGVTEGEAGDSETSEATVLYSSKFDLLH